METTKKYEPWEELPEENLKRVRDLTDVMHAAVDSMEYNLETDTIKVPGQNWVCVSFVSPSSNQKTKSLGMKIRGVFDTNEEAVSYVKRLIRLDPTFDIFICEMYNWCLIPPDPEKINDQVYQNEELNKIISEYRKNQIYAKEHFEERKREMVTYAAEKAKEDALRKLKEREEKLKEIESAVDELVINEEHIDDQETQKNVDNLITNKVSEFVSASELMDSMVNSECAR
jgi:hypothetical protein